MAQKAKQSWMQSPGHGGYPAIYKPGSWLGSASQLHLCCHQGSCLPILAGGSAAVSARLMPLKIPRRKFRQLCVPEGQGSHIVGSVNTW